MNSFFTTDDEKGKFYKGKGLEGNQLASDFFGGAFQAADDAGLNYIKNYSGDLNDNAFFTGLGEAKSKGWDDWFNETRGNTDLNQFDFDFDGAFDSSADSTNFFDTSGGYGDLFTYNQDADTIIDNYVNNNSSQPIFDDVTGNIKTTRRATQEDVDNKLATEVGEVIEEMNIPSKADANRAGYAEKFNDALDELNLKKTINDEALENLLKLNDELKDKQLSNLNTQYQEITDTLRGDTLNAMRAGMSGTNNATNRLLVDANMNAARERTGIRKQILDSADLREYSFGKQAQAALTKMRNDFAELVGATPDETDWITALATEWVELQAQQGKIDVKNAEDWWQANYDVLEYIAEMPNTNIQLIQNQVERAIRKLTEDEFNFREEQKAKFENMGDIAEVVKRLSQDNPELGRLYEQLNFLNQNMQSMQR
mgnify:CR=1 FL=1